MKKARGDDDEASEMSEEEVKATGSKQEVKKGKKVKIRWIPPPYLGKKKKLTSFCHTHRKTSAVKAAQVAAQAPPTQLTPYVSSLPSQPATN